MLEQAADDDSIDEYSGEIIKDILEKGMEVSAFFLEKADQLIEKLQRNKAKSSLIEKLIETLMVLEDDCLITNFNDEKIVLNVPEEVQAIRDKWRKIAPNVFSEDSKKIREKKKAIEERKEAKAERENADKTASRIASEFKRKMRDIEDTFESNVSHHKFLMETHTFEGPWDPEIYEYLSDLDDDVQELGSETEELLRETIVSYNEIADEATPNVVVSIIEAMEEAVEFVEGASIYNDDLDVTYEYEWGIDVNKLLDKFGRAKKEIKNKQNVLEQEEKRQEEEDRRFEEAQKYGIAERDLEKHKKYLDAKEKYQTAKTLADFETVSKEFSGIRGYLDADKLKVECDEQIKKLSKEAKKKQEDTYKKAVGKLLNAQSENDFSEAQEMFESVGEYKDAKKKARECREKVAELQEEKKRIENYESANALLKNDDIESVSKAKDIFEKLGHYSDSQNKRKECEEKIELLTKRELYEKAELSMTNAVSEQDYRKLQSEFESFGDFLDSEKKAIECSNKAVEAKLAEEKRIEDERRQKVYDQALTLAKTNRKAGLKLAINKLEEIADFNDASAKIGEYKKALRKKKINAIFGIIIALILLSVIIAAAIYFYIIPESKYNKAVTMNKNGDYINAYNLFYEIKDYSNSDEWMKNSMYKQGEKLQAEGEYDKAIECFEQVIGYEKAKEHIVECINLKLGNYNDNGKNQGDEYSDELTPTVTDIPKVTATSMPKTTATSTPKPAATNTPKPAATNTPKPTATNTPKPTATNTPKPTPTNTPTPQLENLVKDEQNGVWYELSRDKSYYKASLGGAFGDVVIAEKVNGIPVYSVIHSAFGSGGKKSVTSVIIPDGIKSIEEEAFSDFPILTEVSIPSSVTSIGNRAFYNCDSLSSINIPDGVNSIENETFFSCENLTNIYIPNSVKSIGEDAFYGCVGLTSVQIPNSVMSIGDGAFKSCRNLENIILSKNVTRIARGTFSGCNSLTDIIIPNSVTKIDEYAFQSCKSLTEVIIPESVTSIGKNAFSFCENMTTVTIQDGLTSIEDFAFENCKKLTCIVIPESVTNIKSFSFKDCRNLKKFYVKEGSYAEQWAKKQNAFAEIIYY